MTTKDKCELAIEMGYRYDAETGKVYGVKGREITAKILGYPYIHNSKFNLKAHQFAWYWVYKEVVDLLDHINKDRSDNRINNLRVITHQQNSFNTNAKGYHFDSKRNKWRAMIGIDYKQKHIGYYNTEEEAKQAYLNAKQKLHKICQ